MPVNDGKKLVVIPAYNEEGHLGAVLEALKPLTKRSDYAVVVVDDGSTDNTAEIARGMGYKVLSHERNLGKTQGVLTGVRYARENGFKFMAMIDADTLNLRPEMVEALIEPLKQVREDGRPVKQMTFAHIFEGGVKSSVLLDDSMENPALAQAYDMKYSGQRAFRVSAFDPYFNNNRKWVSYLKGRWPEPGLNKLFTPGQTLFLPDLTFVQRRQFHGGDESVYARFIGEQADAVNYSDKLDYLRAGTASKIRGHRKEQAEEGGKTATQRKIDEARRELEDRASVFEKLHLQPPAQDAQKKHEAPKKTMRN